MAKDRTTVEPGKGGFAIKLDGEIITYLPTREQAEEYAKDLDDRLKAS